MIYILIQVFLLIVLVFFLPVFGRLPAKHRLLKIKRLANYNGSSLENLEATPVKPEDMTYPKIIYRTLIKKHLNRYPACTLPSKEPDYQVNQNSVTWFGHSSYLLQIEGQQILVDPILSMRASPFQQFGSKAFKGTDILQLNKLPSINYVLFTHDHYDHLDYHFIKQFDVGSTIFITSLGVGAHLEYWGVVPNSIIELSWGESIVISDMKITAEPARHFSGRGWRRNKSLWSSFVIESASGNYYVGGDSGYGRHFKTIGDKYGAFRLAILECGQYNSMWPLVHMFPEETVQAAKDLNAEVLLPVHWGKFSLSTHPWDEPAERVLIASKLHNQNIMIPYLGETVAISQSSYIQEWWKKV